MAAPKKPLVNWFSRTKEKSSEQSDSTIKKTKKVTAPESKLSRGFSKEKTAFEDRKGVNVPSNMSSVGRTTKIYADGNFRAKTKEPNEKGGGGTKVKAMSMTFLKSNNGDASRVKTKSYTKERKPSTTQGGVSLLKNRSMIINYDDNDVDFPTPTFYKKTTPKLKKK
jgi:hypothetical protein